MNSSLEELIQITVIFILRQGMFRLQNLPKSVMFLTHIRAFPATTKMPRHAKAWKFKRPLSQNEEPFRTKKLFMQTCLGTVIPRESRNLEESIVS